MAATVNTTAQFEKFVTTGKVSFRNIQINAKDSIFSLEFAFLEGRKKKFEYQEVSGKITPELKQWLTKAFIKNNGDAITGNEKTSAFMLMLERKGIAFEPGVLKTLEFTCDNTSQNFDDCPFRLTISPAFGTATLNLVYKYAKIVKNETINPETGKVHKEFGYYKYANMKRENYRRLEIFIQK